MDQTKLPLLTPYNYHEWKTKMEIYLRSLKIYRVTMGIEIEPTTTVEKRKWYNRCDQSYGTLCLYISPNLNC